MDGMQSFVYFREKSSLRENPEIQFGEYLKVSREVIYWFEFRAIRAASRMRLAEA